MSSYADLLPALDRLEAAAAEHKARHAAEIADLKRSLDLANADYADLKADFEAAGRELNLAQVAVLRARDEREEVRSVLSMERDSFRRLRERQQARYDALDKKNSELWIELAERDQRIADLEDELGRSEGRRYEP